MTVTYSLDVSTASLNVIYKLLFRWKGSVWKAVYIEWILWLILYGILTTIYRLVLSKEQKENFEDLCILFSKTNDYIPVAFLLGFYVTAVFNRWFKIFDNMGFIDSSGLMISQFIKGKSEKARMIRRSAIRYMVLMQAIVFRDISKSVRKRFPTMQHIVAAGLMTDDELKHYEDVVSQHRKYWQPMHWCFGQIHEARQEGLIASDIILTDIMGVIRTFRSNVINLTLYDWVGVPLVYSQVAHLTVWMYFIIALFARQFVTPERPNVTGGLSQFDMYFPLVTSLQFIFVMGWLKAAEVMLNPFGEDDDDFECNWILDRNLQVGLSMVDDSHDKYPSTKKDFFWEDKLAEPLYTEETANMEYNPQIGSCAKFCKKSPVPHMIKKFNNIDQNSFPGNVVETPLENQHHSLFSIKEGSRKVSNAFRRIGAVRNRRVSEPFYTIMQTPPPSAACDETIIPIVPLDAALLAPYDVNRKPSTISPSSISTITSENDRGIQTSLPMIAEESQETPSITIREGTVVIIGYLLHHISSCIESSPDLSKYRTTQTGSIYI